jgi:hypothetical protein
MPTPVKVTEPVWPPKSEGPSYAKYWHSDVQVGAST